MFTFDVFWCSLGTSIFGNSSWAANDIGLNMQLVGENNIYVTRFVLVRMKTV